MPATLPSGGSTFCPCRSARHVATSDGRTRGLDMARARPCRLAKHLVFRRGDRAPFAGIFGCMGLFDQIDRGFLHEGHRDRQTDGRGGARLARPPDGPVGMLHDHGGDPQVTGDVLHRGREAAMFPAIAVATRCAATLAAMHPTARASPDRRRPARRSAPGAGPRPAARRGRQSVRLHGVGRRILTFRAR